LNDKGRKNALKVAKSFTSPAPILNFKASGEQRRTKREQQRNEEKQRHAKRQKRKRSKKSKAR
jgi:hypothetical protein